MNDAAELSRRIARFVAAPDDRFAELALAAYRLQREAVEPYAALCARRGLGAEIADWRDAPLVPTAAFKSLALHSTAPLEVFRSSGTGGSRSEHHHPFPELYRLIVDASFPAALLDQSERPPMLSLVPSRRLATDSSLAFMIDHVLAKHADPAATTVAVGARGVEAVKARSWLAARQRDRRPAVILATSLAVAELVDGLARLELRFRLAPGTRLFETGGFKTKAGELRPETLAADVDQRLGLGREALVREYGMTELTSQCYSRRGGDPDLLFPPPWLALRLLEPQRLVELPPGEVGLLSAFDLGNVGSVSHVLTEDLAVAEPGGGFRLVGRAAGAELRGCSQLTEALQGGR